MLWGGVQIRKQLDPKWSMQLTPILRMNNDLRSYQNHSWDVSLRYRLSPRWHIQGVSRTWIVPDVGLRQFWWLDIGHQVSLPQLVLTQRVRYHHAMDLRGQNDLDYVRLLVGMAPRWKSRWTPTIGYEYWHNVTGARPSINYLILPGMRYRLSPEVSVSATYRLQAMTSAVDVDFIDHLWLVFLVYQI